MMSSLPLNLQLAQDEEAAMLEERMQKPEWLEPFIQTTYFEACPVHSFFRNEKNGFCITCCLDVCQHCLSSPAHRHHKIIQLYKHVYKEVASISSIENYIDCSKIQPYKCNKRQVLALKPLPHVFTAARHEVACRSCSRRLAIPTLHRYCSIGCKVRAFDTKSSASVPPYLSPVKGKKKTNSAPKARKRSRKGTPRRAPFF